MHKIKNDAVIRVNVLGSLPTDGSLTDLVAVERKGLELDAQVIRDQQHKIAAAIGATYHAVHALNGAITRLGQALEGLNALSSRFGPAEPTPDNPDMVGCHKK